jgi:iron complex transport system substrate-binding protein
MDDLEKEIVLTEPANKIISLAPNITEILFHIGAGSQIIGADEYSNYPEAAKQIIRVNNHSIANYELILSLKPDLILAWYSGNGVEVINRLRELGLPVFVIETTKIKEIPDLFKRLGKITGNETQSIQAASEFSEKLVKLQSLYVDKKKVKTFYQIWDDPIMTLSGKHLVSDVIDLCAGVNVFAEAQPLVPRVNIEAIINADPEVILSSGSEERIAGWREKWSRWPSISAVDKGHLYLIPPDLMQRQSSRILDGATYVCDFLDKSRVEKSIMPQT